MGLKDKYHRPHAPEISDAARAWVVSVACTKPNDHGLAAELWSISALAKFAKERAQAAGFAPVWPMPARARSGASGMTTTSSHTRVATTWKNVIQTLTAKCTTC